MFGGWKERVTFLVCVIAATAALLAGGTVRAAAPASASEASGGLPLDEASGFYGLTEHVLTASGGLSIQAGGGPDGGFVLPFHRSARDQKLKFTFSHINNFRYFFVDFAPEGRVFDKSLRGVANVDIPGHFAEAPVYYLRIPDGDYDRIHLNFRSRNEPGGAVLESVTVVPLEPADNPGWSFLIALAAGVLLLVPGVMLYAVLHGSRSSTCDFLASIFAYSLIFYVAVYLFLIAALGLDVSVPEAHSYTLLFAAGLLAIMALLLSSARTWPDLGRLLRGSLWELGAFFVLLLVLCLIITHDANLPIENMFYRDIAGPKTFRAFFAHDAIFQYVNGLAIADDDPFEKYYANHQLIYDVQDRQMLPGVIYGVFRALMAPVSATLAGSYFVYTLIGVAMNLMILFPAAAIARRYMGLSATFLLLLLLSANAFMVGNYLITWFKMAGGALFASGIYFMLEKRISQAAWGRGGLLFGLGANMHAGVVLGIPFFCLWTAWRGLREHGWGSPRTWIGPVLLVAVFVVVMTPWQTVKRHYFDESYALVKTHFLGGYSSEDGLLASAREMLAHTTWEEQYTRRLGRLADSFRLEEIGHLESALAGGEQRAFLELWDRYEFNYLAFVLYPGVLFVLLGWLYRRFLRERQVEGDSGEPDRTTPLLWISVLTMVVVILAHFGHHAPDIVYHQPMGVLVLANLVILGLVQRSPRGIRFAYYAYAAFAVCRLALFL